MLAVRMLSLLTLVFVGACARQAVQLPAPGVAPRSDQAGEISQDYRLGPEDVIEVMVWKNADLSRTVTILPDGKISLPLIGDVQAAGHTVPGLTAEITQRLETYYKEPPQVSVIVQQVNSYAIYILGEVANPGKQVVKTGTTFLHAIALAGGFTAFAATKRILIRRVNGEHETAIGIRYRDVIVGRQKNIVLQPGDIVIVP